MTDRLSMTPAELMADPAHMIAWLKILPPNHVVAENMRDANFCLGTRFLRAHGHATAYVIFNFGGVDDQYFDVCAVIERALLNLVGNEREGAITAAVALRAFARAKRQIAKLV